MTTCPKCRSDELRVHGSRSHVSYRPRWGIFGPSKPSIRVVALDLSCAECFYAFTLRESGISDAPLQTAYQQLAEARNGLSLVKGKGRQSSDDEEQPAPVKMPRPAPDPRNRKR